MNADPMASGWYYFKPGAPAGQQAGPFTWEQLYSLAQSGTLTPSDMVWNPALPDWLPAAQIPGLFPAAASPGAWGAYAAPGRPGATYQPYPMQPAAYPPERRRSRLLFLVPLVALLLVGGGLGIYFGLVRGGDDKTTASTGSTLSRRTTTTTLGATTTTTTAAATTTTAAPSAWDALQPDSVLPAARDDHSIVYDSIAGQLILFGGADDAGDFNDTWAYDLAANAWTDLNPPGDKPSPRDDHCMVFDEDSGMVILFGGVDDTRYYGDTWVYDPSNNAWTNLNPSSAPSPRADHRMVYDSAAGKVILFGGSDDVRLLNDTWVYDFATNTWTELNPGGDVPSAREGHRMVYDPDTGRVILFGGYDGLVDFNDTWAYDQDANAWTELDPAGDLPAPRDDHSLAYDAATHRVILFGGYDGATEFNDTWAYDLAANTWTNLEPTGDVPSPRDDHSMASDAASGKVFLFGGSDGRDFFNDLWAFGG